MGFYDQAHLEELAASIGANGLFEPVLVRSLGDNGEYEILSGHCRVRAVRRLKQQTILCQVLSCDDHTAKLIFCSARMLTRSLSAIEEALILRELVQHDAMSMTAAGQFFGRGKWWVSRRLKLLFALEPAVQAEVGRGTLPPRLAQELARLPRGNTDQLGMLVLVQQYHLSKDELAYLVDRWLKADEAERDRLLASFVSPRPGRIRQRGRAASGGEMQLYAVQKLKTCARILDDLTGMVRQAEIPATDWWPDLAYRNLLGVFRKLAGLLGPGGEQPIAAVTSRTAGKEGF
jgi:ParB family chromosome partitioning protein